MSRAPALGCLLLLAGGAIAFADSFLELAVSSGDLGHPATEVTVSLELDDERAIGASGGIRWYADAWGSVVPAAGSLEASAAAGMEGSLGVGDWVATARVSGEAAGSSVEGPGPLAVTLHAYLVANGETASCQVESWATVQALIEPYGEAGGAVRVPVLAGSSVVEPSVAGSYRWNPDGTRVLEAEPAVHLSWYPAVPLAVDVAGRWIGTIAPAGSLESAWGGKLSISGALGERVLLLAEGWAVAGSAGATGEGTVELSLALADVGTAQVALPIRARVTAEEGGAVNAALEAGLRLSW